MKRTTGALAYWSAVGGDFLPIIDGGTWDGVQQADGTYVTVLAHPDGRTIALHTRRGDGWQPGRFMYAIAAGEHGIWVIDRWTEVRVWLLEYDPEREQPYCLGEPARQPRPLDGRERDILCRILGDIERACRDRETQQLLLSVVCVDPEEIYRLLEVKTILNPRTD